VCSFAASPRTFRIQGRVRTDQPLLTITAQTAEGEEDGFVTVKSVRIHQGKQLIETISFDDDLPVTAETVNPLTFDDYDCDGYRDIAITTSTGVHGDFWKQLYRFDPKRQKFVRVEGFEQYPSPQPDCKLRLLNTYVNSGFAGCMYERGVHRWAGSKLEPVETESQIPAPPPQTGFVRTIEAWKDGHKSRRVINVTEEDCQVDSPE
jgi:hypothetical protein